MTQQLQLVFSLCLSHTVPNVLANSGGNPARLRQVEVENVHAFTKPALELNRKSLLVQQLGNSGLFESCSLQGNIYKPYFCVLSLFQLCGADN